MDVEAKLAELEQRIQAEETRSVYFAQAVWVLADKGLIGEEARQLLLGIAYALDPSEGARPKA